MIAATTLRVLDTIAVSTVLRDALMENARYFRARISGIGYTIAPGIHPIVAVTVHEAEAAQRLSASFYDLGIIAMGFFFPVLPRGKARVRVYLSAAHTRMELDRAVEAFSIAGRELGIVREE